ncbi:MAG: peptide-binding protein [Cellvibrionales bacterium TMED122]|nr:peptide-binding protein [Halieaceae bacterium]OUV60323.1 MAG: peptide-binding protein [Cellvibrionales bacterium TMED122]
MKLLPNYGRLGLLVVCSYCAAVAAPMAFGQDTRYVSDRVLVPVRSGAGSDFRIVNSGLPSGTALMVFGESEDGKWAEIETRAGIRGWMPSQFLQAEPPASLLMNELKLEVEQLRSERDRVVSQLNQRSSAADEADDTILTLRSELEATTNELTEVKRVSAAALDLDALNQQLVAEVESERSDADLLRLENVRLRERIANNQILDGALAVLLGVILAVVTPRLWPGKKRQDGWS